MVSPACTLFDAQRVLSRGQAIPVVGPIFVSPIKLAVGLIQVIGGIVIGVFAALGAFLTSSETLNRVASMAFNEVLVGGISIGYSVANIVTLGIFGYCLEDGLKENNRYQQSEYTGAGLPQDLARSSKVLEGTSPS